QQLQRNVDQQQNPDGAGPAAAAANQQQQQQQQDARFQYNIANRRNGDVEGVRQSANFISRGSTSKPIWNRDRALIPAFTDSELAFIRKRQNELTDFEESYYDEERKK